MLVLTRRPGETIRIGQNIVITVLKLAPGQVRIGIEAPADVVIHREEIFQRIHGNDPSAAATADDSEEPGEGDPDGNAPR
jgi:carbon storage regulator